MNIITGDLTRADVIELLTFHLAQAHESACTNAHSIQRLQSDDIHFFEARSDEDELLGIAALKILAPDHGEIKSVRTHPDHLRKGVSKALMEHLTMFAQSKSISRLSLETHGTPAYEAARGLYERLGYSYCAPFADYSDTVNSVYMTKLIGGAVSSD